MNRFCISLAVALALWPCTASAAVNTCVSCHEDAHPHIVAEWKASAMGQSGVNCTHCHGSGHSSRHDAHKATRPTITTCSTCHDQQAARFSSGKHGMAEAALRVSSMGKKTSAQAPAIFEQSCATCHNGIGRGGGQCDACHAGHKFSPEDAKKPEACLPCHMGNHSQYESYSFSKHGALYAMRGPDAGVPTCATCHMAKGDHMVKTSWGFFGIRGEEPNPRDAAEQKVVRAAVELLGPILAPDSTRPTLAQWTAHREDMLDICADCHARSKAKERLEQGDAVVATINGVAANYIAALDNLKQLGGCDANEYFWTIRDNMHAQRINTYVSAFHQHPEGVLLGFVHFKKAMNETRKEVRAVKREHKGPHHKERAPQQR